MEKVITIKCTGASALDIGDFVAFQGQLKSLATEDYRRLRNLILDEGFIHPIGIWKSQGKHYMLDGHQRIYTVIKMVQDEGYFCPPIPVFFVIAETYAEAKRKLLAMSTQFGRIQGDGLYNFLQDMDMPPEKIMEDYRFADFSTRDFLDEFYVDPTPVRDGGFDGPSELSPNHPDAQQIPREETYQPDPAPAPAPPKDTVSNTQTYKNETKALESFLGSDVRRITIYMNPNDYDQAVTKMSGIAQKYQLKDYRDVLFYLLSNYGDTQTN